jgi:hypothetical protein
LAHKSIYHEEKRTVLDAKCGVKIGLLGPLIVGNDDRIIKLIIMYL